MNNLIFNKSTYVSEYFNTQNTFNSIISEIYKKFTDLKIIHFNATYYFHSKMINPLVNNIDFLSSEGSDKTIFLMPYLELNVLNNDVKIFSDPFCIPLLQIYVNKFIKQTTFFTSSYEDIIKQSNINSKILSKCHMKVIEELEHTKQHHIWRGECPIVSYLNQSVKNLLMLL